MTRTTRRGTGALIATLLALLLSLSAISPAFAAPDHRDDFALGRYMDSSDWGDWSSILTHSLGILALHRAADTEPTDAAVSLLLAQQCDDGSFPQTFRAPSTAGALPCEGSVDATAFAVQALDAVGEDDAVADATGWLAAEQKDDGSFRSEDGQNSTSTGLAALALTIGGNDHGAEVDKAQDWLLALQDDCDAATPGAIPFRSGDSEEDRGVEVMTTSQAVLGLAGVGLGYLDASTASDADPVTGCEDDPSGEFGDAAEAATAYLVDELENSHLVIQGFPSDGATIDVLFALAAVGQGGDTMRGSFDWLDGRAPAYTQGAGSGDAEDAAYAGATAKLALAAIVVGEDPEDIGGIDLIAQLQSLETTDLPEVTISCDVEEAAPGEDVDCTIDGLLGGETVDVRVELNPTLLDDTVTADSSGTAPFAFTVPEDATDEDEVTINVAGLGVDALADLDLAIASPVSEEPDETEETEEVAPIDAVADDADDEDVLPETGDQLSLAAGIGTASLLFGLGLVAVTRRRREVAHA